MRRAGVVGTMLSCGTVVCCICARMIIAIDLMLQMIFFAVQLTLFALGDVAAIEFSIGLLLLPDRLIFAL